MIMQTEVIDLTIRNMHIEEQLMTIEVQNCVLLKKESYI